LGPARTGWPRGGDGLLRPVTAIRLTVDSGFGPARAALIWL
jgi:hypothetical protein